MLSRDRHHHQVRKINFCTQIAVKVTSANQWLPKMTSRWKIIWTMGCNGRTFWLAASLPAKRAASAAVFSRSSPGFMVRHHHTLGNHFRAPSEIILLIGGPFEYQPVHHKNWGQHQIVWINQGKSSSRLDIHHQTSFIIMYKLYHITDTWL